MRQTATQTLHQGWGELRMLRVCCDSSRAVCALRGGFFDVVARLAAACWKRGSGASKGDPTDPMAAAAKCPGLFSLTCINRHHISPPGMYGADQQEKGLENLLQWFIDRAMARLQLTN
jgi:hypothetical protein